MKGQASRPSDLEARIDALYQLPSSEFTAARNALAKTLTGQDAALVKRLAKPALVPWIVNHIFWSARSVYERMLAAGAALRRAQISAIEKPGATGRPSDKQREQLRAATAAHQRAVAEAVHQGVRLASAAGARPPVDVLTRMLETISLTPEHPGQRGRLTEMVEPTGFGVFGGIVAAPVSPVARVSKPGGADARAQGETRGPLSSAPLVGPSSRVAAGLAPEESANVQREAAARAHQRLLAARALEDARRVEAQRLEALAAAERAQHDAERELTRLTDRTAQARTALQAAMQASQLAERALSDEE